MKISPCFHTKWESEREIMTTQDQATSMNYCKSIILKEETGSKYRLPEQYKETTHHLTPVCHILDNNGYLIRNDSVCTHLY